jgi:hypothetical protein
MRRALPAAPAARARRPSIGPCAPRPRRRARRPCRRARAAPRYLILTYLPRAERLSTRPPRLSRLFRARFSRASAAPRLACP